MEYYLIFNAFFNLIPKIEISINRIFSRLDIHYNFV